MIAAAAFVSLSRLLFGLRCLLDEEVGGTAVPSVEELLMEFDPSVRSTAQLTFAATLPLKARPRFLSMDLLVTVCRILESAGVVAVMDADLTTPDEISETGRVWNRPKVPPRVGLIVNGVTILVVGHDRPAFHATDQTGLDLRSWPGGASQISRTWGYVEITEIKATGGLSLDYNYDRAAALTVVAAAVAKLVEVTAIIWDTSVCALSAEQLDTLVAELARGQAPVSLWLGCRARVEGAQGAVTRGLYPLLGAEIEVVSTDLPQDKAVMVALDLATEILRAGEPPAHGAMIDYDKNTEFRVAHRAGDGVGAVPTVVLTQVTNLAEPKASAGAA
jgi:hypothetical protein